MPRTREHPVSKTRHLPWRTGRVSTDAMGEDAETGVIRGEPRWPRVIARFIWAEEGGRRVRGRGGGAERGQMGPGAGQLPEADRGRGGVSPGAPGGPWPCRTRTVVKLISDPRDCEAVPVSCLKPCCRGHCSRGHVGRHPPPRPPHLRPSPAPALCSLEPALSRSAPHAPTQAARTRDERGRVGSPEGRDQARPRSLCQAVFPQCSVQPGQ